MLQAVATHTRTASAVLPLAGGGPVLPDLLGSGSAPFIIYDLHDRQTDRHYVGLTCRTLDERLAAHRTQARRRRPVHPGGLMARLREVAARGGPDPFVGQVVARARTAAEARALEQLWIDRLGAMAPGGYNLMPGGSSVGPDGNARMLTVRDGDGRVRIHGSIKAAIADRNRQLLAQEQPILDEGRVYARLAAGWSAEEALGHQQREDGRGRRGAFQVGSTSYTSLATASAVTGLGMDALRSRLHRVRTHDPDGAMMDITSDRRGQSRGRGVRLGLVWPVTGEVLTVQQFAQRTGVSKATVLHRWHRAQADSGAEAEALTAVPLHERLVTHQDPHKTLVLRLPDGRSWEGGERALVRQLLADPGLEGGRILRLSASGIRRRLRLLSADQRLDPAHVLWAFGFSDERPAARQGTDEP